MSKKELFLICFFFSLLVVGFLYLRAAFTLLDSDPPRLLQQITLPKTQQYVRVYVTTSKATVQPGIQLRKVTAGKETVLGFYAGYTTLQEYSTTDRSLCIHLRDTSDRRPDSLFTLPLQP